MGILLIILGSIVIITGFIILDKLLHALRKSRPCRFILLLVIFILVIDCTGAYMVGTGLRKVMHLDEKEKIENRN